MVKKVVAVIIVWTVGVGISLFWNVWSALSNQEQMTFQAARTLFDQMVMTRHWNSFHNGVYVRVTDITRPNTFLKDPHRDLLCDGVAFTKINPAFMTRQISEVTQTRLGIQFHVTGINPLRPGNSPDTWERQALESFSKEHTMERGAMLSDDNGTYFRYIRGLIAGATCLECHTEKGARLNGILGGISIKIFNLPEADLVPVVLGHVIIWAAGLAMILFAGLKLVNAYETIYRQSILDDLTGIPNRRYFNEKIESEAKRNRRLKTPLSILMADIDNFKAFNDFYGHAKGDEILTAVAAAVKDSLKRPVDLCARYGGEEFIIVLPDTDTEGASHVAQTILDRVRDLAIPHEASDAGDRVSLSLGIACQNGVTNHEKLIRQADTALYWAKSRGKDRFEVYDRH